MGQSVNHILVHANLLVMSLNPTEAFKIFTFPKTYFRQISLNFKISTNKIVLIVMYFYLQ